VASRTGLVVIGAGLQPSRAGQGHDQPDNRREGMFNDPSSPGHSLLLRKPLRLPPRTLQLQTKSNFGVDVDDELPFEGTEILPESSHDLPFSDAVFSTAEYTSPGLCVELL
jgi:hypothetical protein